MKGGGCLLSLRLSAADLRKKKTSQRVCCKSRRATHWPAHSGIYLICSASDHNGKGFWMSDVDTFLWPVEHLLLDSCPAGDAYDVSKSLLSLFKVTLKCPKITTKQTVAAQ